MAIKINSKKSLLLVSVIVLVAAGGAAAYVRHNNNQPAKSDTAETKGVPTSQSGAKIKDGTKTTSADENQNTDAPTATQPLPNATLTIDSFSQSGGTVKVSATATTATAGSCYFGFSSANTKPVSRTNSSLSQSSAQVCSVEIPEAEFTKLGSWQLDVIFSNGNAKVEQTQNVTIN